MKKILYILLFIIIISRKHENINLDLTVFVDSIGFDYNKEYDEYEIYYHVASSDTLLTTELGANSVDNKYSIGKCKCKNLYEGINTLTENSVRNVLITHIQSIIITKDFITKDNLDKLILLVKTFDEISPNFYMFVTLSDLDEIYSIKNPDNISSFFSIITSNNYITTYNLTYYTEFVQKWYEDTKVLRLITIKAEDNIWKDENDKLTTIYVDGMIFIDKNANSYVLDNKTYKALNLISHETVSKIVFDNIYFQINKLNFYISEKNNIFTFNINAKIYASNTSTKNTIDIVNIFKTNVINEINKLLKYCINNKIDIFELNDVLYRKYNKKEKLIYSKLNVKYNINISLLN